MEDQLIVEVSEEPQVDLVSLHKMIFIYNAVLSGWTVSLKERDKFIFVKELDESSRREVNLGDYIKKFILRNLNLM